jgi:hypothetical protein
LKRHFADDVEQHVKGMKMIKDQHGVVFDVAEEKKPLFEEYIRR